MPSNPKYAICWEAQVNLDLLFERVSCVGRCLPRLHLAVLCSLEDASAATLNHVVKKGKSLKDSVSLSILVRQ